MLWEGLSSRVPTARLANWAQQLVTVLANRSYVEDISVLLAPAVASVSWRDSSYTSPTGVLACVAALPVLLCGTSLGVAVVELGDWSGLVRDRTDQFDGLQVVAPVAAGAGWYGPFRVTASDNRDYWVKSLEVYPEDERPSLATEQIVSQVGRLIGAPVCDTSLIRIPNALAGWSPHRGLTIQPGVAHASLAINRATEIRNCLEARIDDDNRSRHVGVYALYDWCFGADDQWLYDLDNDRMLYSHDHGAFFPPAGMGYWLRESLQAVADTPHTLPYPSNDLSPLAVAEVADALEAVDRADLVEVLCSIPASWPVSTEDLEHIGWFLEYRAPSVAARVRQLV